MAAGAIAGIGFLAAMPHVYYLTRVAFGQRMREQLAPRSVEEMLRADLVLIGLAVAITALAGTFLAERYGLPGLGDRRRLRAALPVLVPGGLLLSAGTYLGFGRHLARRVPGYYPTSFRWAAMLMVKGALFEETVARYGGMTILCGAVRRPWLANLMQAAFFTFLTARNVGFYGLSFGWNLASAASLGSSAVVHLALGLAFARAGLLGAALLHLIIDLKYLAHCLLAVP
jgi:hypothetical protein